MKKEQMQIIIDGQKEIIQELQETIDKALSYINNKAFKYEKRQAANIINITYELNLNNREFIELEDILKGDSNENN